MSFIRKNSDWIFAVFFALITLSYPTIKFASETIKYVNNYGDELRKSITFLWRYMLLDSGGSQYLYQVFYFVLLLPIPLVLLASYRFQKNVSKNNLISEEYSKANNLAIFKEVFQAYKRVLLFVMIASLLFLFIAIILPNNGFYEIGTEDVIEAIKMNTGFIIFSLTVSNVSIIVARFTKKYQFTLIFGVLGFLASTFLIALILEGIGNTLGIETLNMDITIYSVIWSRSGAGYLIDLSNGIMSFIISGFIIYLLYSGDKSIKE